MSAKQRKIADAERPTAQCARREEGGCSGQLTVEHTQGRVIQQRWSWIFLCWRHHLGDLKNKERAKYHAYLQATDEDLKEWKTYEQMKQEKVYLIQKYGNEV